MSVRFVPYVYDSTGSSVPVTISRMTIEDAESTNTFPKWQTSWTSDFLLQDSFKCYTVKVDDELIALAAYEIQDSLLIVHIVYMESQPQSNPTMTDIRKYTGIGRLLIAYGIKLSVDNGFGGDVVLKAKSSELEQHYINDFGAVKLPVFDAGAPRYIIADEAAKQVLFSFLS